MGELAILNYDGATTVTWDPGSVEEVEAARAQFNTLMDRGFSALKLNAGAGEGNKIDRFDAKAEKILMFPILTGG